MPPVIVSAFLLVGMFLRRSASHRSFHPRQLAFVFCGVLYFLLVLYCGIRIAHWGRQDLASLSRFSTKRYVDLADPLAAEGLSRVKAMRAIRELTQPGDPILVFPIDCQYYALTGRKVSGRHCFFYANVFNDLRFQGDTIEAISREMPALVVVPSICIDDLMVGGEDTLTDRSRLSHQYLEDFIHENYPRAVFDDGDIALLTR